MGLHVLLANTGGGACLEGRPSSELRVLMVSSNGVPGEKRNGSTAAGAGAGANQSGREGAAGAIQQPGDDSSQSGRVHHELYLYFSERCARKTAEQHDRQSRTRETHLAGAGRKLGTVRSAVWDDQGITGREHAGAERWLRSVEAEFFVSSMWRRRCGCVGPRPSARILELLFDLGL